MPRQTAHSLAARLRTASHHAHRLPSTRVRRVAILLALASLTAPTSVAAQAAGRAATGADSARVSGTVHDSIAGANLAGVAVQFVGAEGAVAGRTFSATTDVEGRYALGPLPAGRYVVGFVDPSLDTLGFEVGPRLVELRPGSQRIDLATPSPLTLLLSVCLPRDGGATSGALIGHVREAGSEVAIAGASVMVEWTEAIFDDRGARYEDRSVVAETRGPGWFTVCELPGDAVYTVRAMHGADTSGYVEVAVPPGQVRHLTFLLGGATQRTIAVLDSAGNPQATVSVWRGGASLEGTVRDREGRPLADARVSVWGSDRESVTDARGAYSLDSLPGGTQTLEVRLIGYQPVHRVVHLSPERRATADVVLGERVAVLSTVETRGQLVYARNLNAFEHRRQSGLAGQFIGPAEIEARPTQPLAMLLQSAHGVKVERPQGRGGEWIVTMQAGVGAGAAGVMGMQNCRPSLYVDGARDRVMDYGAIFSDQIAAIEIYNREISRPPEFRDENPCGAIAVWTRPATGRRR